MSGGQLALVVTEVTTTNHCGQNTAVYKDKFAEHSKVFSINIHKKFSAI